MLPKPESLAFESANPAIKTVPPLKYTFAAVYCRLFYLGKNHRGYFLLKQEIIGRWMVYDTKNNAWIHLTDTAKRVMMDVLEKLQQSDYLTAEEAIQLIGTKFPDIKFGVKRFNKSAPEEHGFIFIK